MTCRCKFQFCYKCGGKHMDCECTRKFKEDQERRREQIEARQAKKKDAQNKKRKR